MIKGRLFVICGPSGVGKGTVVKELLAQIPDLMLSVSVTTRKPREDEVHGKHYFFTDRDGFAQMQKNDEFLESAEHFGTCYGTPKAFVNEMLDNGKSVLLEIDTEGAYQVKRQMPECVLIFLAFPSLEELRRRLINRGSETEEMLELRLAKALREREQLGNFDHVVVNDVLTSTVEQVTKIFKGEI